MLLLLLFLLILEDDFGRHGVDEVSFSFDMWSFLFEADGDAENGR